MKSLQELADKYTILGHYLAQLVAESRVEFVGVEAAAAEGFIHGLEAGGVIDVRERISLIKEVRAIREKAFELIVSGKGVQS